MAKSSVSDPAALPHLLRCDGRSHLSLSGVTEVESFDETAVVAATTVGTLVIQGSGLHVNVLSLDTGDLQIDGHIDALQYEDDGPKKGGLFSRLFR